MSLDWVDILIIFAIVVVTALLLGLLIKKLKPEGLKWFDDICRNRMWHIFFLVLFLVMGIVMYLIGQSHFYLFWVLLVALEFYLLVSDRLRLDETNQKEEVENSDPVE